MVSPTSPDRSPVRMQVAALRRYPVKSMLGEELRAAVVDERGLDGDRGAALVDVASGRVATAKHPRLWRALLQCTARTDDDGVRIELADGRVLSLDDPDLARALSAFLGREVRLCRSRPAGAEVERPSPEDVIEHGVQAEVPYEILEIAQGAPQAGFVDYAAVHLITTATLQAIGVDAGPVRYRPNVVLDADVPAYCETAWVGQEIEIGDVRLRGILPTPRCAVPTLQHGALPRQPDAVRRLLADNRVEVPGFGMLPCAGLYAEVMRPGRINVGDPVVIS